MRAADVDEHACANGRNRQMLGDGVGKRVEEGNGNRDGDETHDVSLPRLTSGRGGDLETVELLRTFEPSNHSQSSPFRMSLHPLHVLPDLALGGRISQQERRVIGRHQDRVAVLVLAAAQRVIGSVVRSSDCAANLPSATMTFGLMMSICLKRNGSHCSTSSGSGLRLPGGRHLMTLAM